MFDIKDLDAISQEYFNIICTGEYDVTVQSKILVIFGICIM